MSTFKFKHFEVEQGANVHPVGTDAMILGALVEAKNPENILDIGTGTGVLSLMMAQMFPDAHVKAIDVNEEAVQLTQRNFLNSPYSGRLQAEQADFLDFSNASAQSFDLIVSNPPFFANSTPAKGDGRHTARHQSSLSLEDLSAGIFRLLSNEGQCWLILPVDQSEILMKGGVLHPVKRVKIYGKPGKHVRDVICLQKSEVDRVIEEPLTIRDEKGSYTSAYIGLTREFHGVAL